MRRSLIGLAVMGLALLSIAAPASAASGQVTQFRFRGTFAEASWFSRTATSFTATSVNAVKTKQGHELFADVFQGRLKNGQFLGGTDTSLRGPGGKNFVTSGFAFVISVPKLASASVRGSGLPARTCTIDANGRRTGCKRTTISLNVSWTGHGPITRSVFNFHMKTAGFSMSSHSSGTDRAATATGTVAGRTLTAKQLDFADLGIAKSADIKRCIGNAC
jgi:hypothetical protein